MSTGNVKCWGANNTGNLGNSSNADKSLIPVNVVDINDKVDFLSHGGPSSHTCVVIKKISVKCWGGNFSGQLGDGSRIDRRSPVNVLRLNDEILDIVTGGQHTCVLIADRTVKCWGSDGSGQLGQGQITGLIGGSSPHSVQPLSVLNLGSKVGSIAAAREHTCAILENGATKCWGGNFYGQLGDGNGWHSIPVVVSNLDVNATPPTITPTNPPLTLSPTLTPPAPVNAPWLYMIYLAGDNEITMNSQLRRAFDNLKIWAKQAAVNPNLTIVVLYDGRDKNDTIRMVLKPGIGVIKEESLPEVNMAAPETLRDFVNWARQNYPAGHTYLAIADHARATTGIAFDTDGKGDWNSPTADRLTSVELRQALLQATNNGAQKLDIVHFDACLMGMFEVAYDLRDIAHYLIASENQTLTIFPFEQYTLRVPAQNEILARDLAKQIAETYIKHPSLAGNNYARTISVLDLNQAQAVNQAISNLAKLLTENMAQYRTQIKIVASDTQKFDSHTTPLRSGKYGVIDKNDAYLDLFDFADKLVAGISHPVIRDTAQQLKTIITDSGFVVFNQAHDGEYIDGGKMTLSNAKGIAIFLPPHGNYLDRQPYIDGKIFAFTSDNQWDEFVNVFTLGTGSDNASDEDNSSVPGAIFTRQYVYLPLTLK